MLLQEVGVVQAHRTSSNLLEPGLFMKINVTHNTLIVVYLVLVMFLLNFTSGFHTFVPATRLVKLGWVHCARLTMSTSHRQSAAPCHVCWVPTPKNPVFGPSWGTEAYSILFKMTALGSVPTSGLRRCFTRVNM